MNAIVSNTENSLDSLDVDLLSEMANNAAANVEDQMRSAVQNAITAGRALIAAKAKVKHGEWLDWLKENWDYTPKLAQDYMRIANAKCCSHLESATSISEALRMIADAKAEAKADGPQQSLGLIDDEVDSVAVSGEFLCGRCGEAFAEPVWHCGSCDAHWAQDEECRNCSSDPADVEYEDVEDELGCDSIEDAEPSDGSEFDHLPNQPKDYYTLTEWESLEYLPDITESDKKLNKQDTSSIEWAQWSWNPITGCKHDCPYCYARDIANRFYEQKFEPSIYPARLHAPGNTKVPSEAREDTAYKNVFTGSMADIFGRWVPARWIEMTMDVVESNPQWNFLFLTKFPQRIHEFGELPSNAWMGTSVDCQSRVESAEKAFAKMGGGIKWLSVEPMLTPIKFSRLEMFDWVVIGGASRSTGTPAWVPPFDWIVDLHQQAREAGCAIYHKDNLKFGDEVRLQEFPWEEKRTRELPDSMKYLGIK